MTEPQLVDNKLERQYARTERRLYKARDEGHDTFEIEDRLMELEERRNELREVWLQWAMEKRAEYQNTARSAAQAAVDAFNDGSPILPHVRQWYDAQANTVVLERRMRPVQRALGEHASSPKVVWPWRQEGRIATIMERNMERELLRWRWWFERIKPNDEPLTMDMLKGQEYVQAGVQTDFEVNNPVKISNTPMGDHIERP